MISTDLTPRSVRRSADPMKKALYFIPIVLSLVVLGAHFLRDGNMPLVAACLILIGLLLVRHVLVARLVQTALVLGALEWLWTLYRLVEVRVALEQPYLRMTIILVVVAAISLCSALLFQTQTLRKVYRAGRSEDP